MTAVAPARLVVLRHAKSAWPDGVADRERPLAPRGRRDAPAAGRWVRAADCVPDAVVCSPARRTRETWELVAPELGDVPEVVFEPRVYEAGSGQLLDVVRKTSEHRRTLLLIGHSPGVQELVLSLAGDAETDQQLAQVSEKFPTSAIAVLTFSGAWRELAPGNAVLADYAVPRGRKS